MKSPLALSLSSSAVAVLLVAIVALLQLSAAIVPALLLGAIVLIYAVVKAAKARTGSKRQNITRIFLIVVDVLLALYFVAMALVAFAFQAAP